MKRHQSKTLKVTNQSFLERDQDALAEGGCFCSIVYRLKVASAGSLNKTKASKRESSWVLRPPRSALLEFHR